MKDFNPQSTKEVRRAIETSIGETLERVFGHGTRDYDRFSRAALFDWGPIKMGRPRGDESRVVHVIEGKTASLALLKEAVRMLEERIADAEPDTAIEAGSPRTSSPDRSRVFIVHGHDGELKFEVARFNAVETLCDERRWHASLIDIEALERDRDQIRAEAAHCGVNDQ
jgi:hypothetical protein